MTVQEQVAKWREQHEIIQCPYAPNEALWTKETCVKMWERADSQGFIRNGRTLALCRSKCLTCQYGPEGENYENNKS